jgi:hypothetical protein
LYNSFFPISLKNVKPATGYPLIPNKLVLKMLRTFSDGTSCDPDGPVELAVSDAAAQIRVAAGGTDSI